MNYAQDALWQHLHHPAVRTLAALLTAPPLWHSGCEMPVSLLLGEKGFRLLEQWDRQPESLPPADGRRLGKYAETLLAAWLARAPHSRLLAAELPVRQAGGQQLGSLDFVAEIQGETYHLELCCKYYAGSGGQPEQMIGFDPRDTLRGKAAKLAQQSALSQTPAGAAALQRLGINPERVRRATIVRGCAFTLSGSLPADALYPPQAWCGRLLHDWRDYRPEADTCLLYLPRCTYPAPARCRSAPRTDWPQLAAVHRQGLFAEMRRQADGSWHETGRLMLRPPAETAA